MSGKGSSLAVTADNQPPTRFWLLTSPCRVTHRNSPSPSAARATCIVEAGIDLERDQVDIAPVPGAAGPGVSFGVHAARSLEEGTIDGFWANGMGSELAVRSSVGTVILDPRRGIGPPACQHYTFPALVTTEGKIAQEPESVAAAVRAIVKAQKALQRDYSLATQVGESLFPQTEAGLITELVKRDLPYYDPTISAEVVTSMNQFARAIGILSGQVRYDQVVATQFRDEWIQ